MQKFVYLHRAFEVPNAMEGPTPNCKQGKLVNLIELSPESIHRNQSEAESPRLISE